MSESALGSFELGFKPATSRSPSSSVVAGGGGGEGGRGEGGRMGPRLFILFLPLSYLYWKTQLRHS